MVVVENAARLSVPVLVQRGIDRGIPPILAGGSSRELLLVVSTLAGVVLVQATSRMFFLRRFGRIGQAVLLELRRRLFRHFQRLDVAFHDRYTSGRVVARSTNDMEAIQEMLQNGFDGLISAVLTLLGTSVLLVWLDVRLGLALLLLHPLLELVLVGAARRQRDAAEDEGGRQTTADRWTPGHHLPPAFALAAAAAFLISSISF